MAQFFQPSEITVGERFRKDPHKGLHDLVESMRKVGQLHAILVDDQLNLIVGRRRLLACEVLDRQVKVEIVTDMDSVKRVVAERDENGCREPFAPSEWIAIGKAVEDAERPKAEARKEATQAKPGNDGKSPSDTGETKFVAPVETGRTADKVADAIGVSRESYRKAKKVVEAAAEPDAPPEVKEAAAEMDRTGKVDPAFKKVSAVKPKRSETPPAEPKPVPNWSDAIMSIRAKVFKWNEASQSIRTMIANNLRTLAKEIES